MNWQEIEGNWTTFKGKVKEKWADLTDDDLGSIEGKRDQLIGKVREKYGYAKEKAEQEADNFAKSLH